MIQKQVTKVPRTETVDIYEHVTKGLLDWNNLITSAELNKPTSIKSPTLAALGTGKITIDDAESGKWGNDLRVKNKLCIIEAVFL